MRLFSASTQLLVLSCVLLGAAACGDSADTKPTVDAEVTPDAPAAGAVLPGMAPEPTAAVDTGPAPETVIVTVNGRPITQGEIDEELRGMLFGGMKVEPARLAMVRKQFGPQAEKGLINQRLLEDAADKEGVVADPKALEERWKEIDKRMPPGLTREAFLKSKGFTVDEANEKLTLGLRLQKLLDSHAAGAAVTDETVKTHYEKNILQFQTPEQVRARHILLKLPPGATPEAKAELKKQIEGYKSEVAKNGKEHFQVLAKQHSACPSSAQGGDLNWFGRGQMVPEFDKVAFDLPPGTVSDPVLTQFGWHILLVEDKREAGTRPLEDVKEQIKARLEQETKQKATTDYVEALRKAATIERKDGKVDEPAAGDAK